MSRRLHVSVWTPTVGLSVLLYTIHFETMSEDEMIGLINIVERGFIQPLEQKEVRLMPTLRELQEFFVAPTIVDLATHWWRCASDVNGSSERTIINMQEPTISFDLANNGIFTTVYLNEEGSMQRLSAAIM
jgi:hypothetical protein